MKVKGIITDKNNNVISNAIIEIKDEEFQTVYQTMSDNSGYYEIACDNKIYPFLIGVKDYAIENLEYWCHNLDLTRDQTLDFQFDKLEIYGTNVFQVKGGYPSLMIYFRPMSLEKYKLGLEDITPDIKNIIVKIDDNDTKILIINQTKEYCGLDKKDIQSHKDSKDENSIIMNSYLMQVELVNNNNNISKWKSLTIQIEDYNNNFAWAKVFNKNII